MKKADVRASFTTPQEKAMLLNALTSVVHCKAPSPPDDVVKEAQAQKARIKAEKPFKHPSLLLSVYLSPSFLTQSETDKTFRSTLWSWDHYLSTMIKSGWASARIWNSFLQLPVEQQKKIRFHRSQKNKPLHLYAQLFYLLNNAMKDRERQELLAKLITEESAFVSQQLRYDPTMRQQYLYALSGCGLTQFKSLIQLLSLCPPLADDFAALITGNLPASHLLQSTIKGFIQTDESIAFALLRNSALCETEPEFVAQVLLNRTGALKEYQENVESTPWLLLNAIKGFLAAILPYSLLRLMSPPLPTKVLDHIESLPPNFKPDNIFKTTKQRPDPDMTFLAFQAECRTLDGNEEPSFIFDHEKEYVPPSPIRSNPTLGTKLDDSFEFGHKHEGMKPQ